MIRFAPIVSVVAYFKETEQMNPEMNELTKNFLKIGYQRQLTYRHLDGSFSAFGPRSTNENGGTWLTAFVLRCLADAYHLDHITIDKNDLELSFNKLLSIQAEDGSFPQVGAPLLSKSLSGGLKDQTTGLSAYVMVVLLKTTKAIQDNRVENQDKINKGIKYLRESIEIIDEVDTYTLALISYAFKLANVGEQDIMLIMEELDKRAIIESKLVSNISITSYSDYIALF
jgi:CD109 antigen